MQNCCIINRRPEYSLPRKDTFTKYCWRRLRSRTDTPRKTAHFKRLKFDKDAATISKGYLSDNAIKYSLKEKTKVHIIDSVEAKWLNSNGHLAARIDLRRRQPHIEDIFVILHFDSPQHFACLHVKESTLV